VEEGVVDENAEEVENRLGVSVSGMETGNFAVHLVLLGLSMRRVCVLIHSTYQDPENPHTQPNPHKAKHFEFIHYICHTYLFQTNDSTMNTDIGSHGTASSYIFPHPPHPSHAPLFSQGRLSLSRFSNRTYVRISLHRQYALISACCRDLGPTRTDFVIKSPCGRQHLGTGLARVGF
jgi:hypothetical protein